MLEHLQQVQRVRWLAGDRVPAEVLYGELADKSPSAELLLDLVYSEYCLREELGETPVPEEYEQRFPEHIAELSRLFELHRAMENPTADATEVTRKGGAFARTLTASQSGDGLDTWHEEAETVEESLSVLGDCVLLAEIGRGGMGVVYRARQRSLGRMVAVKVLASGQFASPDDLRRFHAEAKAAASLRHPGIVPVYSVGEDGGQHYFVMELVDGTDLEGLVREQALPVGRAVELLRDVAGAVEHAHAAGVLHRDLKPSNILIDHQQQPRVTDFGLARRIDAASSLTGTGQILGTPGYMPPEQAAGHCTEWNPASDVYGLGAVLYCVLTGRPPYRGGSVLETLQQVLEQDPVPPRQVEPGIPRDLETVCLKCLDRSPGRRYQTARELADELERILAGQPVLARPTPAWERLWRTARRHAALTALIVVSLVAVVVVLTTTLRYNARLKSSLAETAQQQRRAETGELTARKQTRLAEQRLERARRSLYALQLTRAAGLLESDPSLAKELLDDPEACPPELRDFAWRLLRNASTRVRLTYGGHQAELRCAAVSPEGRRIATGDASGHVHIWDAKDGKLVLRLATDLPAVNALDFHRSGNWLAVAGESPAIELRSTRTGELVRTLDGHTDNVNCVRVHGDELVSGSSDSTAILWNPIEGNRVATFRGHTGSIFSVDVSPDGSTLLTGSRDGTARLWEKHSALQTGLLNGHQGWVTSVGFAPDGATMATGSVDRRIRLWSFETRQLLRILEGHLDLVSSIAWSPDGGTLASAGYDRTVRLWDVSTGAAVQLLREQSGRVTDVKFIPQTRAVVSASQDYAARVWSRSPRHTAGSLVGHDRAVTAVAFLPKSGEIVSGGYDGTLRFWNLTLRQSVDVYPDEGWISCLATDSSGSRIATGNAQGVVTIRNRTSRTVLRTLTPHPLWIACLTLSPDGNRLVTAGAEDNTLSVRDVESGTEVTRLEGHAASVTAVAFSTDGQTLATADTGGTVRLWNTDDWTIAAALTADGTAVRQLCFDPNGTIVVAAHDDGRSRVWNLKTQTVQAVLRGHQQAVTALTISPDGRSICTGSIDRTLRVWDPVTGHQRADIPSPAGEIHTLSFSVDSQLLVIGGSDGRIHLLSAP